MTTLAGAILLAALTADFTSETGRIRPELHSSCFGPQICSCSSNDLADIRSMGFKASRTHDWALLNAGQRVCDYLQIFPLMHLDAKDPRNYVFKPTDYLFKRTREELGHDIFFRLGPSIEHSGNKVHFNAAIPEDFDKVAETFAGTIRHYNRGWAEGFNWNIKYWELWCEPDGVSNMWCLPEGDMAENGDKEEQKRRDLKRRDLFVKFFVKCLKRIKSEFPDVKVGGPGMCDMNRDYFRALLAGCKEAGVAPDFISWHHYVDVPEWIIGEVNAARRLCDEFGFKDCELIISEFHYFCFELYGWKELRSPDPEVRRRAWSGPGSHNGIDSSCFNLALMSKFQRSCLGQAFYYGCKNVGAWGFKDAMNAKYKVFYGLQLFGEMMRGYTRMYATTDEGTVTMLAASSADGGKRALLVTDYRGKGSEVAVDVKGIPDGAKITARVHDYTRDLAPADFTFIGGRLTLKKADANSAAFFVTFE